MSHYTPIFFFPISNDELPVELKDWHSAEKLLSEKWENREQNGLRTCSSRNWWLQYTVTLICEHLQINGLEFLEKEIVCLDSSQIETGINAISNILNTCRSGIPELTPETENESSIWLLRYDFNGRRGKKFSTDQIENAYNESCVVANVDCADVGYDLLVGFFSFLKSLQASMQECLSQNKKLFYVQPD